MSAAEGGAHVSKTILGLTFFLCLPAASSQWTPLLNGKNLDGWETVGDGVWSVMNGGILMGDRVPKKSVHQAWLYTKKEYGEFDLQLEYWTRIGGNSGVSIRDHTRARYAVGDEWDRDRTPSHNGYEIQIINGYGGKYPSGSVYLFAEAKPGLEKPNDWNLLEIRSRNDKITVLINGQPASEHPGDPARPKNGPIGLQLHDANSVVMFRNIRIRQIAAK
ncbi:MAG: DUF1080 domain-containing protein [Acidimicrobiia bacterium]|nr:DUF1080 domain-containing protein [Acidimicrobiia bacterium]